MSKIKQDAFRTLTLAWRRKDLTTLDSVKIASLFIIDPIMMIPLVYLTPVLIISCLISKMVHVANVHNTFTYLRINLNVSRKYVTLSNLSTLMAIVKHVSYILDRMNKIRRNANQTSINVS